MIHEETAHQIVMIAKSLGLHLAGDEQKTCIFDSSACKNKELGFDTTGFTIKGS